MILESTNEKFLYGRVDRINDQPNNVPCVEDIAVTAPSDSTWAAVEH